jgi:hypothetical protein
VSSLHVIATVVHDIWPYLICRPCKHVLDNCKCAGSYLSCVKIVLVLQFHSDHFDCSLRKLA